MKMSLLVLGLVMSISSFAQAAAEESTCGGYSTIEMKLCAEEKYEAADKELNEVYRKVLKASQNRDKVSGHLNPNPNEVTDRLVKAQRAWLNFRDANCSLEAVSMLGGTGEGLIYVDCLAEMTKKRTLDFYVLLKDSI